MLNLSLKFMLNIVLNNLYFDLVKLYGIWNISYSLLFFDF